VGNACTGRSVGTSQPSSPARGAGASPEPPALAAGPEQGPLLCWEHPVAPQPPAPQGDQHISPALPLLPLNPLLWLPEATQPSPKHPGGRWRGDTSTLSTPALLAVLPYTAVHAQQPPGRRPRLCPLHHAPAPVNIQLWHQLWPRGAALAGGWGGMPLSRAAAAPAPPRSGRWW